MRGNVVFRKAKISIAQNSVRIVIGKAKLSHPFDSGKPNFRINRTTIYLVDIQKGQRISVGETSEMISPEATDMFMARKTVESMVASVEKPQFMQYIVYIILSLSAGIPLGYIIGQFLPFK